jgi:hypothetical protein
MEDLLIDGLPQHKYYREDEIHLNTSCLEFIEHKLLEVIYGTY